jgi:hypothetical protein
VSTFVSDVFTSSIVIAGSVPGVNFAGTVFSTSATTVHVVEDPEQAPPQPRNDSFASGCAASSTRVPESNPSEHSGAQLTPGGLLVTRPAPLTCTCASSIAIIARAV